MKKINETLTEDDDDDEDVWVTTHWLSSILYHTIPVNSKSFVNKRTLLAIPKCVQF